MGKAIGLERRKMMRFRQLLGTYATMNRTGISRKRRYFIMGLADENPEVRKASAMMLRKAEAKKVGNGLANILKQSDARTRLYALRALEEVIARVAEGNGAMERKLGAVKEEFAGLDRVRRDLFLWAVASGKIEISGDKKYWREIRQVVEKTSVEDLIKSFRQEHYS